MRKWILAVVWLLPPPLFVIVTTPFAQLPEHSLHIFLFGILGLCMAGFSVKEDVHITKLSHKKWRFIPSFPAIILASLLVFLLTYSLPCPCLFSPHTAQTAISHPCSQPTAPGMPVVSFAPTTTRMYQIALVTPKLFYAEPIQNPDNKAPPTA